MTRRKPYSGVKKTGQKRPSHVKGMGDVVFKGFQCLNGECREFIFVRKDELGGGFSVRCPACGYEHRDGGSAKLFGYTVYQHGKNTDSGEFQVHHNDYIREAGLYKYCLLCYAMKPIGLFSSHGSRQSGRQGECRMCKTQYNTIKNPTRISDQHREASQRRRLYKLLSGEGPRIDTRVVYDRFEGVCFCCDKRLTYRAKGKRDWAADHTLPAKYLWPMTTDTATLLCSTCNGNKGDKWPSEFYEARQKLKELSRLASIEYHTLAGQPILNPKAVREILDDVDAFIQEWIQHPDEIRKVRQLLLDMEGIDIFQLASLVPRFLLD